MKDFDMEKFATKFGYATMVSIVILLSMQFVYIITVKRFEPMWEMNPFGLRAIFGAVIFALIVIFSLSLIFEKERQNGNNR